MIFKEKEIILKNGVTAILKTPEVADAKLLLDSIRTCSGETNFLARNIEDWASTTTEDEEKWIINNRKSDDALLIGCYIDGKIVGNCDINFSTGSKLSHRAVIGIAIQKKYWNMGIGTAMFEELLNVAREHKGTEIVELEYLEDNERGKALYQKFGFQTVCERPKVCKLKNGTYQSLIYMQKYL